MKVSLKNMFSRRKLSVLEALHRVFPAEQIASVSANLKEPARIVEQLCEVSNLTEAVVLEKLGKLCRCPVSLTVPAFDLAKLPPSIGQEKLLKAGVSLEIVDDEIVRYYCVSPELVSLSIDGLTGKSFTLAPYQKISQAIRHSALSREYPHLHSESLYRFLLEFLGFAAQYHVGQAELVCTAENLFAQYVLTRDSGEKAEGSSALGEAQAPMLRLFETPTSIVRAYLKEVSVLSRSELKHIEIRPEELSLIFSKKELSPDYTSATEEQEAAVEEAPEEAQEAPITVAPVKVPQAKIIPLPGKKLHTVKESPPQKDVQTLERAKPEPDKLEKQESSAKTSTPPSESHAASDANSTEVADAADEAESSQEKEKPKPTVLIVEDGESFRRILSRFLTRHGIDVETAENGSIALEKLRGGLTPHMVISDFHMTVMNGEEFIRNLRKLEGLKELPVLVLTSDGEAEAEIKLISGGANCLLRKDVDSRILLAYVKRFLGDFFEEAA